MTPLETAEFCLFIAGASASLTLFLDYCFSPGNILDWWLDFWMRVLKNAKEKPNRFSPLLSWLAKPMGECPFCMNFWISFALFGASVCISDFYTAGNEYGALYFSAIALWFVAAFSFSHSFLRVLIKYINA